MSSRDILFVCEPGEDKAMDLVNLWFHSKRFGLLNKLNTSDAGGSKVFEAEVWAGACKGFLNQDAQDLWNFIHTIEWTTPASVESVSIYVSNGPGCKPLLFPVLKLSDQSMNSHGFSRYE